MKNIIISIISLLCISLPISNFFIVNTSDIQNTNTNYIEENTGKNLITENSNLVSSNGTLHVSGTNLQNQYNQNFRLKGLSSHGIQWYSDIITYDNLKHLRDSWGINVFRIAMYTNENGYISQPDKMKKTAYNIIDMCINLDLYVVIDWHILSDGDPNIYLEQSKSFFNETSAKYKDYPNVIYEICNEPNQSYVTWSNHIKPYAEKIIPIIRNNSKNSVILVGTPDWSKDLSSVSKDPLKYDNIMYTVHFYAATHKTELQNTITSALNKNIPVFVSEWGTTDASGNSNFDLNSSKNWIEFMDKNNLSWINWSFCNKSEDSAILSSNYNIKNSSSIDEHLTKSGEFIKANINTK